MNYKDDFKTRNKILLAEEKCIEYLNKNKIVYTRFGFDALFDISWKKFNMIPPLLRNKPDYMVLHTKATLLEVKGCHDILRLKQLDMKSYDWWSNICSLNMFLFSTKFQEHKIIKYEKLNKIALTCETGIYPENKKVYYKIPWDDIK
jgi:hypothetical protein